MKFAIVGGERREATISGQRGVCPGCGAEVVAKCERVKVNHWAHLSGKDCDGWHEPETEWHRMWKNQFPVDWQEKDFIDEKTGEHHRADVYTPHGLTIQFRHAPIKVDVKRNLEEFYLHKGNMIWVVNGTRDPRTWIRFQSNRYQTRPIMGLPPYIGQCRSVASILPYNWSEHAVPIFFDFLGVASPETSDRARLPLLCVLPTISNAPEHTFLLYISREDFMNYCINENLINWLEQQKRSIYELVEKRWEESPTPPPTSSVSILIDGKWHEVIPPRPRPKRLYLP